MSGFYSLPQGIVKTLVNDQRLNGSVFIPLDKDNVLEKQFTSLGFKTTGNSDEQAVYDDAFWVTNDKKHDYIVCVTIGDRELADHVCNWGVLIAKKAVIVLDRVTFLEPVKKRRDLLENHKISNMIVLNPRPQYRAMGTTKDSVTSCWFTFKRKQDWADGTHISFAVDWNACKPDVSSDAIHRIREGSNVSAEGEQQKTG